MEQKAETFSFPLGFQKDLLGCLVVDKKFLRQTLGLLKPEYFEKKLYALACKSIHELFRQTKTTPTKSNLLYVLSEAFQKEVRPKDKHNKRTLVLKPVQKLLKHMYQVNGEQKFVKKKTMDFCQTQEMKRTILETYSMLESSDNNPDEAKSFLNKGMRNLNVMEYGGKDMAEDIEKLPGELFHDKSRCLSTGYPSIDKWMDGGMDPGTLSVFMAPSKFGKSMILVNVGHANLLAKKTVVHFTLEISEKKIMSRYVSRITGIPMRRISQKPKTVVRKVKKFFQLHGGRLIVKGYPSKSASVETLTGYLHYLKNQKELVPDLVIVDYGDILRSVNFVTKGEGSERFIQGDVFEGLRAMGHPDEFDCSVVSATQCNRAAASKSIIHMEDISESYQKCMISDHIITLCGTKEERKKRYMRLFFAGSREAETGRTAWLKFDFRKSKMVETEEPQDID